MTIEPIEGLRHALAAETIAAVRVEMIDVVAEWLARQARGAHQREVHRALEHYVIHKREGRPL